MQGTVTDFRDIIGSLVNNFSIFYCYITIHLPNLLACGNNYFISSWLFIWAWLGWMVLLQVSLEVSHETAVVWRLNWIALTNLVPQCSSSWFVFSHSLIMWWPSPSLNTTSRLVQRVSIPRNKSVSTWLMFANVPLVKASHRSSFYSVLQESTQQWEYREVISMDATKVQSTTRGSN